MSSKPSRSKRLPSDERIDAWITAAMDESMGRRNRKAGASWRNRVLGGKTVVEAMAMTRQRSMVSFAVRQHEWVHVADVIRRLDMPVTHFVRMCIGCWLVQNTDIDRNRLPHLMKDVPGGA